MCLAIPMKIIEIGPNWATVELSGVKKKVDIRFIESPQIGDYIIIHAGFAIQKLDEKKAQETLDLLKQIT